MGTTTQDAGGERLEGIAQAKSILALFKAFWKHKFLRWFVCGAVIGALSALAAGIVFFLLEWTKFFALEYLAGYAVAKPAGEHLVPFAAATSFHPCLLVLLPAIGGLISGLLVYTWDWRRKDTAPMPLSTPFTISRGGVLLPIHASLSFRLSMMVSIL